MKNILIIVDVQNDFCSGGSLEVKGADKIVPLINDFMELNHEDYLIIATKDYHPENHISFAENHIDKKPFEKIEVDYGEQILWPTHCVQDTWGSELHPQLKKEYVDIVLEKGTIKDVDSYSAFLENDKKTFTKLKTIIDNYIDEDDYGIDICGIATDVCVMYTALDAIELGYKNVSVLRNMSAGLSEKSESTSCEKMEEQGIEILYYIKEKQNA